MTEVSNAELQNFFATIFNIDPTYVVPKQANFYNPTSNLSASLKPITWLAYRLKRNEPRTWAMPAVETTIVNGEPIENSYYELGALTTQPWMLEILYIKNIIVDRINLQVVLVK